MAINQDMEDELTALCRKKFRENVNSTKATWDEHNDERYFKELYELYEESTWKDLQVWDKKEFFRLWFIAISDDYKFAYTQFESLLHDFQHSGKAESLKVIIGGTPYINWPDGDEEASDFYHMAHQVLDLDIDPSLRALELVQQWYGLDRPADDLLGCGRYAAPGIQFRDSPPAKLVSFKEVDEYKNFLGKQISPDSFTLGSGSLYGAERLLFVSLHYPVRLTLQKIEQIIVQEREKFFSSNPLHSSHFRRKIEDGREKSYPFSDWERYLKVYMLKRQGKTTGTLAELFYPNSRSSTDSNRKILRDRAKAERLSKNALTGNFPGNYQ